MNLTPSALDWSRGSARRPGRGGGNRGGGFDFDHLDRSSSGANNNPHVRRYIKRMSGLVADPVELDLDQGRLRDALASAGEHSLGVDAITVWMVDEDDGALIHPPGGWWRSRSMGVRGAASDVALARLEDGTRDDHVPPVPVSPGVDIAGILWAESRGGNRRASLRRALDSGVSLKSLDKSQEISILATLTYRPIQWRDIKSISRDPDSAKGPRLKLMEQAGFTMAAGITFQYMHHQGMVIFLTTVEDEDDDRLMGITHGAYLYQAAQFIGATLSLAEIRRASLAERYKLKRKCYSIHECSERETTQRSPSPVEGARGGDEFGRSRGDGKAAKARHQASSRCHIPHQVTTWSRKLRGGSLQIPPSLSWTQTLWTIFGSFVGLLILSGLNEYYRLLSDDEYHLLIGPFGAMCTLMYGLSSAPASQPRNAVMGQAAAGAVSLAFTYVPERVLPVWLRTAVGPAFAIGTMAKLGLVHPPAGAHSVLYASGKYDFAFYALVVLSTAISVVPATVINNMSSKRQYPTYWGLGAMSRWPGRALGFRREFKREMDRRGSSGGKNLDAARTGNLVERDTPLGDSSKRSIQRVQPNRVVVHEDDFEASRHGIAPSILSTETEKELSEDTEKV